MTPQQRKKLKAAAHHLKPVVSLGQNGLTEAVGQEVEVALNAHELIKIKIPAEREERAQIAEQIAADHQAELIGMIGHIGIFYRESED